MDGDFHSFCDWVNPTHSIEDNVDRANEYLPDAVQREEVSKEVVSEYGVPPKDGFGGQTIDTNLTQ